MNSLLLEEMQKPKRSGDRGSERILSDQQVKEILLDHRVARVIAADYGISFSLVKRIKARTASYFQTRSEVDKNLIEPNMNLVTLPSVAAPVGPPLKLDEEDVEKIRNDKRKLRTIAEEMGISVSTVWRVRNGDYQGRAKSHAKNDPIVGSLDGKPMYESELRSK